MEQPATYVRKPFTVKAWQVSERNMITVAEWCKGEVKHLGEHDGRWGPFIEVDVINPLRPRQAQAFVGDWVLESDKGYKVYTRTAFAKNFDSAADSARAMNQIIRAEAKGMIDRIAEVSLDYSEPIEVITGVVVSQNRNNAA